MAVAQNKVMKRRLECNNALCAVWDTHHDAFDGENYA